MESMAPNGHPTRGRDGAAFGGGDARIPALPAVWRPHRTRLIILVLAALLAGSLTVIAAILPSDGGEPWPLSARIAFACIGFAGAAVLLVLARPKVVAHPGGLTVVNMLRTHRLEWAQVVAVHLRPADPWVLLDLTDGTTLSVMGIQTAEGITAARVAVAELRALVDHYSYT